MRGRAEERNIKRVGLWIRVSTEDQVKGESPEHHERRGRAYAEARDWEVVEVYRLEAVSGKSVMERPETQKMLDHVRKGYIEGLIFSKLARLARNTKELLEFSEIFQECGADLISLQESIDTSTPAGRLFYTVIAAMAQWEREEIAERVAASVPIRAKMGKPTGGVATYGYQWKEGRLIPHPQEAPIRRRIYELFAEQQRKGTVARLLNQAGYRTRSGGPWTTMAIARLLDDPTARGQRRANFTTNAGGKGKRRKPESEWVFTEVKPIVEEELWLRCQGILEGQKRKQKPVSRGVAHLFAGLTYCDCGEKMYVPSNTQKYTCKKCRNKILSDDLDAIFYEQLKGFVLSPDDIAAYFSEADATIGEKETLLGVLEQEELSLKADMDKLFRLYLDGEIPKVGFGDRYRPLEERINQLQDEIPRLQAEIDFMKINYLSSDQVLSGACDLYHQWPSLSFEERRQIVEAITDSIQVGSDKITIDLCYLPSVENVVTASPIPLDGGG